MNLTVNKSCIPHAGIANEEIIPVPEPGLAPSPEQPGPVAQPAGTPPFIPSITGPKGRPAQGVSPYPEGVPPYPEELEDFEGSASQSRAGIAGIIVGLVGAALLI